MEVNKWDIGNVIKQADSAKAEQKLLPEVTSYKHLVILKTGQRFTVTFFLLV